MYAGLLGCWIIVLHSSNNPVIPGALLILQRQNPGLEDRWFPLEVAVPQLEPNLPVLKAAIPVPHRHSSTIGRGSPAVA